MLKERQDFRRGRQQDGIDVFNGADLQRRATQFLQTGVLHHPRKPLTIPDDDTGIRVVVYERARRYGTAHAIKPVIRRPLER